MRDSRQTKITMPDLCGGRDVSCLEHAFAHLMPCFNFDLVARAVYHQKAYESRDSESEFDFNWEKPKSNLRLPKYRRSVCFSYIIYWLVFLGLSIAALMVRQFHVHGLSKAALADQASATLTKEFWFWTAILLFTISLLFIKFCLVCDLRQRYYQRKDYPTSTISNCLVTFFCPSCVLLSLKTDLTEELQNNENFNQRDLFTSRRSEIV